VICEYLDETHGPRLHPADPLERARHRAWMEFGSAILNTIGAFYNAPDAETLATRADALRAQLARIEAELGDGPWFGGAQFSLVDAVFGPVFRYFDVFDTLGDWDFFAQLPKTQAWRAALAARPSVRAAAPTNYADLLRAFLAGRATALSGRLT